MTLDAQGNVYVTGTALSVPTGYDFLTVEHDPAGNVLWTACHTGPGAARSTTRQ